MVYMVFTVFAVLGLPGSGFQPLSHKTAKKRKNRITKPYNITFNGIYDLYVFFFVRFWVCLGQKVKETKILTILQF